MLESPTFHIDGAPENFFPDVRSSKNLPVALQFWMANMTRDLLQLGVFFRAAAIMLQVPGAARYQDVTYDDQDPDRADEDEDPASWVGEADRGTTFSVLAECLRRPRAWSGRVASVWAGCGRASCPAHSAKAASTRRHPRWR